MRHARDRLEIDLDARKVLRDGAAVHLTPTKYALLARLEVEPAKHRLLLTDPRVGYRLCEASE